MFNRNFGNILSHVEDNHEIAVIYICIEGEFWEHFHPLCMEIYPFPDALLYCHDQILHFAFEFSCTYPVHL